MSHMVETMAWTLEAPWHGLGKQVLPDLTPQQMLVEAGLDWTVEKHPAYVTVDGEQLHIGRSALVRSTDKRVLDVIGDDWKPTQNSDAFAFFNDFISMGDMRMDTAGSLRSGQIVWGLAKVNESFELFGGDRVDSYLLFTNPHRYGQAIDVRFTPVRVVCNNTITLALNTESRNYVKISHDKDFVAKEVKDVLGIASNQLKCYKENAEFLGSKRYEKGDVVEFFKSLFPVSNKKDEEKAKELSKNAALGMKSLDLQPGSEFAPGSWWNAFNSVTFMTDHLLGNGEANRLYNSWYGNNKTLKQRAFKLAMEYANKSKSLVS